MNIDIRSRVHGIFFGLILTLSIVAPLAGQEASPAWWADLPTQPASEKPATQAQISILALRALKALDSASKDLANEVRKNLSKAGYNESALRTKALSEEAQAKPLLAEQLISLARPFYDVLAEAAPKWLDDPDDGLGQLQLNGTKNLRKPRNFYPWSQIWKERYSPETPVKSGQLMSVFALRFETLSKHEPFGKVLGNADITSILNHSVDRRLEGLEGGETQMALFSMYDHLSEVYRRNENLWCADLADELNGVATFKGGPGNNMNVGDSYGGVMVTRRHILFCNHAHPAYPGSPPPWIKGLGFRIRFVTSESVVVERELIWGRRVEGQDLWIGLLNEDLPESVKSYRLFPKIDGLSAAGKGILGAVEIGFSQGSSRLPPAVNAMKFQQHCGRCKTSHYGTRTEVDGVQHYEQVPMVYVSNLGAIDCDGSKGLKLRAPFRYCVWDGDSGTPRFHLFGDELLLSRIVVSGGGGGITLGDRVAKLNETIEAVDLGASEHGKIENITKYQVEMATREELEATEPAR